jgi:hypothetical protein
LVADLEVSGEESFEDSLLTAFVVWVLPLVERVARAMRAWAGSISGLSAEALLPIVGKKEGNLRLGAELVIAAESETGLLSAGRVSTADCSEATESPVTRTGRLRCVREVYLGRLTGVTLNSWLMICLLGFFAC